MNYKFIFFIFILFLISCENQSSKIENQSSKIKYTKNFEFYSNKGFALVYTDMLLKNNIVNKKINKIIYWKEFILIFYSLLFQIFFVLSVIILDHHL